MSKKKLALLIGIIGLLLVGAISSGASTRSRASKAAAPAPAAAAVLDEDGVAVEPTVRPAATARPSATPRPTATPKVGTRENPVPLGDGYTFRKGGRVYDITVTDGERDATARVKRVNQFNTTPEEGSAYIVTRLRVDYREGSASQPWRTPSSGYEYYAGNRMWGAPFSTVSEAPAFSGQNIFPGASVDGWLDGKYLPRELLPEALLVFDGVYFEVPA
jgi:hypothetical protein